MNETEYPSYAEIQRQLAPKLDEIRRATDYAQYEDPPLAAINYRQIVREKGVSGASPAQPEAAAAQMLQETFQFLRDVLEHPSEGLKSRYKRLGWGVPRGKKVVRKATSAGYLIVDEVKNPNYGGGRPRSVPRLAPKGTQFLEAYASRK
jgi:hypothetical protein